MTEISDRYARLSGSFAAKVAAVGDDGWDVPTPCPDWTARHLVQHMLDTQGMFLGFIKQELGSLPPVDVDPPVAVLRGDGIGH